VCACLCARVSECVRLSSSCCPRPHSRSPASKNKEKERERKSKISCKLTQLSRTCTRQAL
jgi:hypothetical protein